MSRDDDIAMADDLAARALQRLQASPKWRGRPSADHLLLLSILEALLAIAAELRLKRGN